MKQPIGQTNVDTALLIETLIKVPVGEIIGYQTLSKLIGRDVTVHRHLLESARRIAIRDHQCVFAAIHTEGLKRLDNVQTLEICSENRRKRIHTQARKGSEELTTVNYQSLDRDHQVKWNVGLAVLRGIELGSSRVSVRKLIEVAQNDKLPDADGILKLIGWTR